MKISPNPSYKPNKNKNYKLPKLSSKPNNSLEPPF